ncbi:type I restriction-modification system subunit M [Helicobacter pylori]|uniref:site-specific DNA-methyltransferase (adenine-specific) n=1 Tax=Helicobacter pylori HP260AFii TaxID=1159077 RepID=A0ABC9SBQ0_HELPX|nr:type I restriction-modification system subunit M [Helicobacter pylori]EMH20748.1 type I restriction-modification system, M subunit [Helicobacter pylori GAM260ASi]EMH28820.1 type I restriction-modification system, M subunit [Helicobacter pylori GAM268Bii]EMH65382.1 type I restriction-modification system, M subunit [Helicobacter pylori HP260AFi]EMH67274.1 type I restriction-modification system, M subunit [Helicobacter pylori HP260ASii]EMH68484.1 type I restriction-modification system, M subun
MAIKKSELYSSLWAGADSLRGGMDASEYKNYVLNLLFLKYISDKAKNNRDSEIEVPQGCFYEDILALEGDKEIGDKLNKIIAKIAERNDLKGVIDSVDFNDNTKLGEGKAMIDTLSNLVKIFADLSLGAHGALDDDLLGDAYEYLMRHFASESGKSKGQFYTPSEVSLLLSLLLGIDENTRQDKSIYDPTCGSGSLLLKASSLAGKKGLTIYGQEKDISTTALCKMNMILHNSATADIAKGGSSTLSNPFFIKNGMLQTFDYVVANPPFSLKNWTDGLTIDPKSKQVINDHFNRFEDGTPPEKNGDFAFLLHIIKSLKDTGKGAVILPHGVLFRGNAEGVIRKNLLTKGYIKGVIGLAPNLFYGTSIPACVIVLDKENAHARKGVFVIDASKDFKKDGNKNRLRDQDVQKMIDTFNAYKEIPYYSKMVSLEEISTNDYNLNIPRYIASKQELEKDLFALINSPSYLPKNEIKAYNPYFQVFKELKNTLFKKSDKEGYYALKTECENIKDLITQSLEYQTFHASVLSAFDRLELFTTFNDLEPGFNPKTLIESVCSKVLKEFEKVGILDKYGVYQLFKDYYNEVLQDDWFLISFNGFRSAKELRKLTPLKDKNKKANYLEEPDFVIQKTYYKSDLIPKNLIKQRFFEKETKELEALENALNEKEALLDEFIEEHSNEEGLFDGLKINESVLKKELKNATDLEDKKILKTALELLEAKNKALKMKNKAYEELELKAFHQYKNLEINEIKDLIIKDKWLNSLKNALENKIQKRINAFASALNEIISSYSNSLLELDKEVKESESKVLEHLKDLGLMG